MGNSIFSFSCFNDPNWTLQFFIATASPSPLLSSSAAFLKIVSSFTIAAHTTIAAPAPATGQPLAIQAGGPSFRRHTSNNNNCCRALLQLYCRHKRKPHPPAPCVGSFPFQREGQGRGKHRHTGGVGDLIHDDMTWSSKASLCNVMA